MHVKSNLDHRTAKEYIEWLASKGRYHFDSGAARAALGVGPDAARLALNRLNRQGLIAQPARGFYVVIPPEYRSVGCLPAEQFIPSLMESQKHPYYAGLLSAAQYYGAAHQRPQAFQVFLRKNRRPIKCGKVRVSFIARKHIETVPTRKFNTVRGEILVSTPEVTAIDLVGYPQHAGGLDGVATILTELVEAIEATRLPAAAATAPLSWAQRLGYLLELFGTGEKTGPLQEYVRARAHEYTPLAVGGAPPGAERAARWKIIVNAELETEF